MASSTFIYYLSLSFKRVIKHVSDFVAFVIVLFEHYQEHRLCTVNLLAGPNRAVFTYCTSVLLSICQDRLGTQT